jgi:hypothetical protein
MLEYTFASSMTFAMTSIIKTNLKTEVAFRLETFHVLLDPLSVNTSMSLHVVHLAYKKYEKFSAESR